MTNKLYRIKLSDVRLASCFKNKFKSAIGKLTFVRFWLALGFDQDHYPDKVWMINYSNHQLFKNSIHECQSILTQEDLKMIQTFNTSLARQSQGRFFKRSKTQSSQYKQQISQTKLKDQQNKVQKKKEKIIMLTKQAQELENVERQEELQG